MSVSAQRDTSNNSTTLNARNCLITEDPSLMFSIVKAARDQRVPGSLLARQGGKMRDPGNEVDYQYGKVKEHAFSRGNFVKRTNSS